MNNRRDFSRIKRVVIKIGTNLLSCDEGGADIEFMKNIVEQVYKLSAQNYQVVLVSSGAIGIGAGELKISQRLTSIKMRQACASIGQPILMQYYTNFFKKFGLVASQLLLTREVLNNRKSFLNIRNSFETLIELGSIPICNENDSVSTAEIGNAFEDNDKLSALIASKIDADLLILLTDIDGLYSGNPKTDPDAELIYQVDAIDETIKSYAGSELGRGSTFSTGGMKTKISAAEIASQAGCATIIAQGKEDSILQRIIAGDPAGTFFVPKEKKSQRIRWILNTQAKGKLLVDEGAVSALRRNKSLLPSGIKKVEGIFQVGEVVAINNVAKAVTSFNSTELELLNGCHTKEIAVKLGEGHRDEVARPEDIAFLDSEK
ncbi:MAG: glutamate 5-kinase [Spirochaetia bacterium]|nr:glutamate 5-kinase [Spirochaetia bacterium]MCF7946474.1 glutamate 5-kinase [Spirochaetia bacterium]